MRQQYPTFRNAELSSLVGGLKGLEMVVDEKQRVLDELRSNIDVTDEELRNRTYEWSVHYELKVRYSNEHGEFESWKPGHNIIGWKYHHGEYVETEEEARQMVSDAREEIADFVGKEVVIRDVYSRRVYKGVVIDHNAYWAHITNGKLDGLDKSNRILDEEKPDHQPKGWDD